MRVTTADVGSIWTLHVAKTGLSFEAYNFHSFAVPTMPPVNSRNRDLERGDDQDPLVSEPISYDPPTAFTSFAVVHRRPRKKIRREFAPTFGFVSDVVIFTYACCDVRQVGVFN